MGCFATDRLSFVKATRDAELPQALAAASRRPRHSLREFFLPDRPALSLTVTQMDRKVRLADTAPTPPEAIRVEGLHKSFGPHEVLKGVDLTAHEGDVIAVIGGAGLGKYTMLRFINFL